jgi:hypothetical protein
MGRRAGVGRGCGRGFGRGMMNGGLGNNGLPYQPTKKEYVQMLKDEVAEIQAEIKELEK